MQRSDQFLKSRFSVTLTFMDSKCRSFLQFEITPMFGWSYPEAHLAALLIHDTRIQDILKEALKNLITEA